MTEYFLLNGDDECLASCVTDDDNCPLSKVSKTCRAYWDEKCPMVHVPILLDKTVTERYLRDIIPVFFDFALSDKFQKILSDFQIDENAVLQPVRIVNNKQQVLSTSYKLLYSTKWFDVLDAEASGAKVFPNGMIDTLDVWVASSQKIPKLDLFCAHGWHWILSGDLAKELAKMSNIRLTKIETR